MHPTLSKLPPLLCGTAVMLAAPFIAAQVIIYRDCRGVKLQSYG